MASPAARRATNRTARVATWNAEWAPVGGVRGRRVTGVLSSLDADVICLTEGFAALLPDDGHIVEGARHGGFPDRAGQRRVLLWSRRPWGATDDAARRALPHQGFVSAVTDTPVGSLRVLGVCVPWHHAGVRDGRHRSWELHGAFLEGLGPIVRRDAAEGEVVAAGDFNQFVPRIWGPRAMEALLREALGPLRVATSGSVNGVDAPLIDHIAHSPGLEVVALGAWPRRGPDGPRSDHDGVWVDLRALA